MRQIKLTQGKVAIVDDADYEVLSKHKWYAQLIGKVWYAQRNIKKTNGQRTIQKMHRLVMNPPAKIGIDHINGNGLDNCRCNLRICSQSENCQNQKAIRGGTSKFKGVHFHKQSNKWMARIHVNYKSIYLGVFDAETKAAIAYNEAAAYFFGDFARLNEVAA